LGTTVINQIHIYEEIRRRLTLVMLATVQFNIWVQGRGSNRRLEKVA
jgi:hypothetical protein